MARWSSGLRLRPLTPATRVRISYGSPLWATKEKKIVGVYSDEGPPVPIPNTAVKLISAENTWGAAPWEDRATPTFLYASIAQSVEHAAVNRGVTGSSPVWGAKKERVAFATLSFSLSGERARTLIFPTPGSPAPSHSPAGTHPAADSNGSPWCSGTGTPASTAVFPTGRYW